MSTVVSPRTSTRANALGRLSALGPQQPWQVALLLPTAWDDLREPLDCFDFGPDADGRPVLLQGRIGCSPPLFDRVPRLPGVIDDAEGRRIGFTVFGDSREFLARLRGPVRDPMLYGVLKRFHDRWWLTNPEIIDHPRWIGRLRPAYPGKARVIAPDTTRNRVLDLLEDAIPQAARWIRTHMGSVSGTDALPQHSALEAALWSAHLPKTPEAGQRAQLALERLAARVAVRELQSAAAGGSAAAFRTPADWRGRAAGLAFALTDEQQQALDDIVADLRGARPMRRLLNGETGSGKTAVFITAAAACIDGGGRVAVLTPNARLAEQAAAAIRVAWPDLDPVLVTGDAGAGEDLTGRRLVTGTTALLHRDTGRFDLVIVDEQQKFSREQREQLTAGGAHLLEVSATCIPRSQALVRYGAVNVSRLRKGHVEKHIHTRIWSQDQRERLFGEVRESVRQGHQVIIIYPRRDADDLADTADEGADPARAQRLAAEQACRLWERVFPGRVALAHGGLDEHQNAEAMTALRDGRADLLVATTVVEVGIDLPRVRRVVVVHPQYLGLTQLHQLRGRTARAGGEGWFDLYLPEPVGEKAMQRFQALMRTIDGFRLAALDLKLRGAGDLRRESERQWGADDSFLYGRPLRLDLMDTMLAERQRP